MTPTLCTSSRIPGRLLVTAIVSFVACGVFSYIDDHAGISRVPKYIDLKCQYDGAKAKMLNKVDWTCGNNCCDESESDSPDVYPRVYQVQGRYCYREEGANWCFLRQGPEFTACSSKSAIQKYEKSNYSPPTFACHYNRYTGTYSSRRDTWPRRKTTAGEFLSRAVDITGILGFWCLVFGMMSWVLFQGMDDEEKTRRENDAIPPWPSSRPEAELLEYDSPRPSVSEISI